MHLFAQNKYTVWYFNLVNKAQSRVNVNGYKEIHHIIPKCIGGDNSSNNLVELTAREHFICHVLLPKMVLNKVHQNKLLCAIRRLKHSSDGTYYNSRLYELLKPSIIEAHRKLVKGVPQRKRTEEECKNLSRIAIDRLNNMSDEKLAEFKSEKARIARKTHTGRKRSKEVGRRISKSLKGKTKQIRMDKEDWLTIRRAAQKKHIAKTDLVKKGKSISKSKLAANKKYSLEERHNLMRPKIFNLLAILYDHYPIINDTTIKEARTKNIIRRGAQISEKVMIKWIGYIPLADEVNDYFHSI